MNVEECIEKGLLKRDIKDVRKALRSIVVAKNKLSKAMKLNEVGFNEEGIVNAYSAMFHAGRGLLFRDGMREKSHFALCVYLKEKYKNALEPRFLNELDSLRMERHEILYSLDTIKISKEEVSDIISVAMDFISAVEKILGKN
ncbi:MAG: HEPN domain-containing protein [Candidatus Aenigmarchaeota archaeon]|nr:HEPN domain-containing protein [Candidatus Aenigmarchaeota archaeon]